jgi:DNA-3-methyladenine glycosylase
LVNNIPMPHFAAHVAKQLPPGPYPRLERSFYLHEDVVAQAEALLGKILVTTLDGIRTAGIIIETEAYRAPDDKACHAYNNRRTARTEVMFRKGGHAYIYLCYGIHHLFNVVTGPTDAAQAVLIRALWPLEPLSVMLERRGNFPPHRLCAGPGTLSRALGLHTRLSGQDMLAPDSPVWIEDAGIKGFKILSTPRIGVEYAEECATWPWRKRVIE